MAATYVPGARWRPCRLVLSARRATRAVARARVYAPSLTGLGDRAHLFAANVDLDCHIRDIVNLLHSEDLRDVILVGHSHGGMVITGAADRAAERVGHLVYLDAATPVNGQTLVDQAPDMMAASRAQSRIIDGVEMCLYPTDDAVRHYGCSGLY